MSDGSSISTLRRARIFLGLPGWLLLFASLAWNLVHLLSSESRVAQAVQTVLLAVMLFSGAWFLLALVGLFVLRVRCPSCGALFFEGNYERYFLKAPVSILLMNTCRECGLSIGRWREAPPNTSLERTREG
jgi:hypothetical protein